MRTLKVVSLAFAAAIVVSAMASAAAFAQPQWLDNGSAIATAVATTLKGKVVLADLAAKVKLECEGTGSGTVGPGAADDQEALKATKCKVLEGTCPSPSAEPVKLPWKTELVEESGNTKDEITVESGWKVTCAGIIKDTCTAGANAPTVLVTSLSPVEEEFVAASNENVATCSLTGEKKGDVAGSFDVEGTGSNVISVEA